MSAPIQDAWQTSSDDILNMLADVAREFCTRSLTVDRLRALRGTSPAFDRAQWRAMADLGWLGVVVPESSGGLELGTQGAAILCRALGVVAAPEPMIETAVAAATLCAEVCANECATDGVNDDLVSALLNGSSVYVAALGSVDGDAFAHVHATGDKSATCVTGTLQAVPLGMDADSFIVPAMLGHDPAWLFVERDATGLTAETKLLADGASNARLTFNNCDARILLTGPAAHAAGQAARVAAELAASAYQLGLADTMIAMTIDYVGTRRQFGQAIGSFQSIQHRLVDAYMALRLADAVVTECAAGVDAGARDDDALRLASRARQRSGEALLLITRESIQLHGAIGYTDECDIALFANRALVIAARYGRPDAHVARIVGLRDGITLPSESSGTADTTLAIADRNPAAGDWNAIDNDTFRGIVRSWHTLNYPPELKNLHHRVRWAECREWYERLYRRGFAAPGWPLEHGGMGLAPDKLLIFIEERERLGIARTPDQGIIMIGPLLMKHGTSAQQAHYLPRALSGKHIWCQGYSEPNAGSDLASLQTTAVREGDDFVINGQKIWTTMAQDANQMFCLVRTDANAKPQAGISFVLIDFATPGITVRPIRNIAGDDEFCEVFFDDVRVPCNNLVGRLNDGWSIAKALLGFERFFVGSPKTCRNALSKAMALAVARGTARDPVTVDRYTRFELDVEALESLYKAFADLIRRGEVPGADISLLKIYASETFQRLTEFALDLGGETGVQVDGAETEIAPGIEPRIEPGIESGTAVSPETIDALYAWYNARPTTIYGGSNEIQRNIIAKLVLRLPTSQK